jgi:spermidine synthase/MFS family permease
MLFRSSFVRSLSHQGNRSVALSKSQRRHDNGRITYPILSTYTNSKFYRLSGTDSPGENSFTSQVIFIMGSASSTAGFTIPNSRLVGVGLIVFLANAAMLVLQLVAGRLLAPFIGSSLETWTSVIGVFLAGIALGNAFGGRIADRYPSPRTLSILLAVGAVASIWMAIFPLILNQSGIYKSIPLGSRIPLLTVILCLPASFVLSLLTPLAIKLGVPDLSRTGRVAGMVFALSTLGCLVGNYLTGFYLIPTFTINTLVVVAAGTLFALSIGSIVVLGSRTAGTESEGPIGSAQVAVPSDLNGPTQSGPGTQASDAINPYSFTDIRLAYLIVFLSSFGGMTLELTASRVLAQNLGVSLFTWTGIIGVMLAGTALGNLTGGWIADRSNKLGSSHNPRYVLAGSLLFAAGGIVFQFVPLALITRYGFFASYDPISQVLCWTFCLFFVPMFALGTISPQVIRLAVPDVGHVGQVAGRVYAWSTTGAIVGTFLTGYLFLSSIGWSMTILSVSLVLAVTSLVVANVWNYNPLLYTFSIVLGGVTGGVILTHRANNDQGRIEQLETNYYTIKTIEDRDENLIPTGRMYLYLDRLLHSIADTNDPIFLYYKHEQIQVEFLRAARYDNPNPRVLVIGGGGYTFPRYSMEMVPETRMDVVEIDPGVTLMAKKNLGLKDYPGLTIHHMDGRQFVAEKVQPGTYDLVVLDAVNDFSVPSHLLTKEFNDAVKTALKPDGVYLLTVIDSVRYGKLWKAAMHTLQQSYPSENVALLTPDHGYSADRQVYVIYASNRAVNLQELQDRNFENVKSFIVPSSAATYNLQALGGMPHALAIPPVKPLLANYAIPRISTKQVPPEQLHQFLDSGPRVILTDQYAPVDNLMADVFRYRDRNRPEEESEK